MTTDKIVSFMYVYSLFLQRISFDSIFLSIAYRHGFRIKNVITIMLFSTVKVAKI